MKQNRKFFSTENYNLQIILSYKMVIMSLGVSVEIYLFCQCKFEKLRQQKYVCQQDEAKSEIFLRVKL